MVDLGLHVWRYGLPVHVFTGGADVLVLGSTSVLPESRGCGLGADDDTDEAIWDWASETIEEKNSRGLVNEEKRFK